MHALVILSCLLVAWRNFNMKKSLFLFVLCMSLTASVCAQQVHFDGKSWWNHVKVLADDNMEGRETGSTGLKKAEAYVVEQLKKDGLQPAGVNGFYQPVKFESRELDEKNSSLALVRNGKAELLALGDDAIFGTRIDLAPSVEAPLVFVGYGMDVPEKNYSDLAGLDLKGSCSDHGRITSRDSWSIVVSLSICRRTLE